MGPWAIILSIGVSISIDIEVAWVTDLIFIDVILLTPRLRRRGVIIIRAIVLLIFDLVSISVILTEVAYPVAV